MLDVPVMGTGLVLHTYLMTIRSDNCNKYNRRKLIFIFKDCQVRSHGARKRPFLSINYLLSRSIHIKCWWNLHPDSCNRVVNARYICVASLLLSVVVERIDDVGHCRFDVLPEKKRCLTEDSAWMDNQFSRRPLLVPRRCSRNWTDRCNKVIAYLW